MLAIVVQTIFIELIACPPTTRFADGALSMQLTHLAQCSGPGGVIRQY
jgi:hypothetical protein